MSPSGHVRPAILTFTRHAKRERRRPASTRRRISDDVLISRRTTAHAAYAYASQCEAVRR